MNYINCILSKETTISFVKRINSIEIDEIGAHNFFERARTFDDVSLIVSLRLFFDISEKIRKRRNVGLTNDHLIKAAKDLENDSTEFLVSLDILDQSTILHIIQFDYLELRGTQGNLLSVLSEIHRLKHNGQII